MLLALNCLGLLALCGLLALLREEPLVKLTPAAAALWILALYLLALVRCLHAIDALSLLCIAALLDAARRRWGKEMGKGLAELLFPAEALALYLLLAACALLLRGVVFTSHDSVGCWALEVKSIAAFDGFAPRYQNAAVEFGSYAPGTTLFRWWTYHLLRGRQEGMIAVGTAWLVLLLLAPLLAPFRCRPALAPLLAALAAPVLLLLPATLTLEYCRTLCAELPIAAACAQGICAMLDRRDRATGPRLAAALLCMCFFKGAGVAFALSLLPLLMLLRRFGREGDGAWREISVLQLARTAALCLLPSLSWALYCRLMERASYFRLARPEGAEELPVIWRELARPYLAAMLRTLALPLHDGGALVNLSLPVLLLGLGFLFWLAARAGSLPRAVAAACALYLYAMTALLGLALFVMHSFVFREAEYFAPAAMLRINLRYALPLLLGWLLVLAHLFLSRGEKRSRRLAAALLCACVLLCAPIGDVADALRTDEASRAARLENRALNCSRFANCLTQRAALPEEPVRILLVYYKYTDEMPSRRYLQYEMAPDSILPYELLRMEAPDEAARSILALAAEGHAQALYCCGVSDELLAALGPGVENDRLYVLPLG